MTNEVGGKSAFSGADVTEFSAATGALVRSLSQPLLDNCNGILALAADGGSMWVTGSDSNDGAGWVAEFNATTGALIRKIVAAAPPEAGYTPAPTPAAQIVSVPPATGPPATAPSDAPASAAPTAPASAAP